jgi:hypothetical protein
MTCNIVFDFHSPHNNEYWYRCTTCGATDWLAYYDADKTPKFYGCKKYMIKYICLRKDGKLVLIHDIAKFADKQDGDSYFELGREVRFKTVVEAI